MCAGRECIPLLDCDRFALRIKGIKLADHRKCLGVADDLHIRIAEHKVGDHGTVIRFHMVDNKVIQCPSV